MTHQPRFDLVPVEGFRSTTAATFIAQLEDLSRRLTIDASALTADDYAWQPERGVNTIGMLLVHIPIVEVMWTESVLAGRPDARDRVLEVLGVGVMDDGMPIEPGDPPPANLAGRTWPYFAELLARGRQHLVAHARTLTDDDLVRPVERDRAGKPVLYTPRWMLHHLVEHFMGHYGQILLLRHLREGTKVHTTL